MDEPTEPTEVGAAEPTFVIVRGRPDAHELAALTGVLMARLRALENCDDEADDAPRAPWGRPARARPRVGWATGR
ncbi:acyl-CoA carboxylase subunit epsilon [Streptomyces sp. NPDC001020]